jgi:hypothetical protein
MICDNIITKHIALIILRNWILVIIVINFEKFLMTSEKIIHGLKRKKNYHLCKILFNSRKIKNFLIFVTKNLFREKILTVRTNFNEMFESLIIYRSIFFTLKYAEMSQQLIFAL